MPFLWRTPLWCLLGFWWLKPWLDRGVLFVLSRVVFGQSTSVWDFLREWRAVHRRGLVAGLLWRRLSPLRSYVLPIFQLEGLRGAAYRRRARLLTRQSGGVGFLLTCSGWLFTLLTFVGFLALLQGMVPPGSRMEMWSGFATMSLGFQWLLVAVGMLALTLTEPFFVAGGFGLYLNRRTHLEGWDLELAFRRLAARLCLVVLLLVGARCAGGPGASPSGGDPVVQTRGASGPQVPGRGPAPARGGGAAARAEDPEGRSRLPAHRGDPGPELRTHRPGAPLAAQLLDFFFAKKEPAKPSGSWSMDFLKGLWDLIALVGKVVLVGGLLTFVLWLIYRFRHRLGLPVAREMVWEAPAAVAGLDIRPESLPPDVPAAARHLFVAGSRARLWPCSIGPPWPSSSTARGWRSRSAPPRAIACGPPGTTWIQAPPPSSRP